MQPLAAAKSATGNENEMLSSSSTTANSTGSRSRFVFNIPSLQERQAALTKATIPTSPRDNLTSKNERQPALASSKAKTPHRVDSNVRDEDVNAQRSTASKTYSPPSRVTEGQASTAERPKFNFNIPSLSKALRDAGVDRVVSNKTPRNTLSPNSSQSSCLAEPPDGVRQLGPASQARGLPNWKLETVGAPAGSTVASSSSRATFPRHGKSSNWKLEQSPPYSARATRSEAAAQPQNVGFKSPPLSARSEAAKQIHNSFSDESLPTSARSQPAFCKSPPMSCRSESAAAIQNDFGSLGLSPSSSKASLTAQVTRGISDVREHGRHLKNEGSVKGLIRKGMSSERKENDDDSESMSLLVPAFDVAGQLKLVHEQIHHTTREVGDMQKEVDMLNQSIHDRAAHVEDLEVQFQNDMQKVRTEISKNLAAVSDEYQEKHAETADALEAGLAKVTEDLQAELSELRLGFDRSLDSMRDILENLSQQVETITSSTDKERELRIAVEAKLDEVSGELRGELQDLLPTLSKVAQSLPIGTQSLPKGGSDCDLAEFRRFRDETTQQVKSLSHKAQVNLEAKTNDLFSEQQKVASELRKDLEAVVNDCAILKLEVQTALKCELQQSLSALRGELAAHAESVNIKHDQIQDALNSMSGEHHETKADLENVLRSSHAKLQDELQLLKSHDADSVEDLRRVLNDMTQQVGNLEQAAATESSLRMTVEAKVAEIISSQDKAASELRDDVEVAVNELQSALKSELAILSDEVRAAAAEGHSALKDGLEQSLSTVQGEVAAHVQFTEVKHSNIQDSLQQTLSTLQNELAAQVKLTEDQHSNIQDSMKHSLSTLQGELAAHVQHAENKHSIIQDSLQRELSTLHDEMEGHINFAAEQHNNTQSLHQSLSTLQDELASHVEITEERHRKIQGSLKSMSDEHRQIHTLSAGKFQAGQSKLYEEIRLLKSGGEGSLEDLQKMIMDVTQQVVNLDQHIETLEQAASKVDNLEQTARTESNLRMIVEAKVEKMLNEQAALGESHAALRLELADHSRSADEVRSALAQGQSELKGQLQESLSTMQDQLATMLTDVTQQLEAQMGKSVTEQDKTVAGVREDVMVNVEEAHAALKRELLEHGSGNEKIKADMDLAHAAFTYELQKKGEQISELQARLYNDLKIALDSQLDIVKKMDEDLHERQDVQRQSLERLTSEFRMDVAKRMDENHRESHDEQAQSLERVTSEFRTLHANTVKDMQHDLRTLRSDSKDEHAHLQKSLTDVGKQVDALTIALQRRPTQDGIEKMLSDLRQESSASLKEVSTSLHSELVAQVCSQIAESEKQHRFEIERTINESVACKELIQAISDKQTAKFSAYDQRFLALEWSKEVQDNFERRISHVEHVFTENNDKHAKEVDSLHSKFCEMLGMFNTQRSAHDNTKALVDQRLESVQRTVAEVADSYAHALRDCRAELSKELAQRVKGERTSREALECSFVDYVQEARAQNQKLETKVLSFLSPNATNQPVSISLESPPESPFLTDRFPKVESRFASSAHPETSSKLGTPLLVGGSPKPQERTPKLGGTPRPGERRSLPVDLARSFKPGASSPPPGDRPSLGERSTIPRASPKPDPYRSPKLSSSSKGESLKVYGITRSSSLQISPSSQCRIVSPSSPKSATGGSSANLPTAGSSLTIPAGKSL